MTRFILRTKRRDAVSGFEGECLHTIDVECPELETAMAVGGYGGSGYHHVELVGVEIITNGTHEKPRKH